MTLVARPRRLRRTAALRDLFAETRLDARQLIQPLCVRDGRNHVTPIASMPGQSQFTVDRLAPEIDGVPALLLFGIPAEKNTTGPIPHAITTIKREHPNAIVIADVCLCAYTSDGHCEVTDNDTTLPLLANAAVSYADAGADIVAPSAMMDGQVAAIRRALDDAGHTNTAIMSYAVKYASAFYGPFRDAAQSAPAFGDRRGYQMNPPNIREALHEAALDEQQGADILMVKPAGPYLDVIAAVRANTNLPLAAYQVSGEYAMLKAAAQLGALDEKQAVLESLMAIKRAGADVIITYYAKQVARWLAE